MGTVKRLLLLITVILAALTFTAGAASAQERPDVPPPTTGPTFTTSETNGATDYDGIYDQCTDTLGEITHTGFDIIDIPVGVATSAVCQGAKGAAASVQYSAFVLTVSKFWGDPIGKFAAAVMEGNITAFGLVMTFWMNVPIPTLAGSTAVTGIRNLTWELQIVALAFGIGVAAIRVAIARRHAVAEGADEAARMLMRTLFSIWTLPTLVIFLHEVGDSFSTWVLRQAADGDPVSKINAIAWINEKTGFGPVVALLLAGIGLVGSIAQLIALLLREAVLAIAVAVSPIAAAASVTGTGRQTWSGLISYTIAALLFKPAASLIYAVAFWAASSQTASDAVVGAVLLAVAGISMPALIRVITPAAASISSGGGQLGGMLAGAGAGAGAGRASGSRAPSSTASGQSSNSGGGSSGSSSAPAASGARSPSQGGGGGGGGNSGSSGGSNPARSGGLRAAAGTTLSGAGKVLSGAGKAGGFVVTGAALAGRAVGRSATGISSFAEGAIGNYQGHVPR